MSNLISAYRSLSFVVMYCVLSSAGDIIVNVQSSIKSTKKIPEVISVLPIAGNKVNIQSEFHSYTPEMSN